ncbi:MAG: flagellar basal body-associated FliL family protein [Gammaproteobacteria bacterium]
MKKILYLLIGLVVLAVPVGMYATGNLPFLASPAADAELDAEGNPIVAKTPHYLTLDPPFIVNFVHRGSLRYLQLSLDLMYLDESVIGRIQEQMPEVRNDLILLFSSQDFETLSTLEGKEKLRSDVLLAVNKAIDIDPASPGAAEGGEVYITNFVMQ